MRISPFRRLLVLALLLASCGQPQPRTGPAPADAERAIRAAFAEYVRAVNDEDWDRTSRVWARDVIGWNSGDLSEFTYADVRDAIRQIPSPDGPRLTYSAEVVEVLVSGEMAVARVDWTVRGEWWGDTIAHTRRMRSFEVWRLQRDGSWKIARSLNATYPWNPPL